MHFVLCDNSRLRFGLDLICGENSLPKVRWIRTRMLKELCVAESSITAVRNMVYRFTTPKHAMRVINKDVATS